MFITFIKNLFLLHRAFTSSFPADMQLLTGLILKEAVPSTRDTGVHIQNIDTTLPPPASL